jgi:DNA repair protein RecO (recombination protein O)
MLHQTKGIVIHSLKYSESSIIVKIYTALFGLQSYLIKGVRSQKSKIKPALFQPLTLLELVVYHNDRRSLHSVKEVRLAQPFHTIPYDIIKSSIALFIDELLYRTIREEEANPELFGYIWESSILLDNTEGNVSNFHLLFLLELSVHLGIYPQQNHSKSNTLFNLREGIFQADIPNHPNYLDNVNSKILVTLLNTPLSMHESLALSSKERHFFLETLLLYFRFHLPGFTGIKSHHVLHSVLS